MQVTNGTDLYSLLQSFCGTVNADFVMQPGFVLQVGQTSQSVVSLGADRTSSLVFREGQDQASKQRTRARNQIMNMIGAENSDGHEISAFDTDSAAAWGQREGWFQTAAQVDPASMEIAAAAAAADQAEEVLSWTLTIPPGLPGTDGVLGLRRRRLGGPGAAGLLRRRLGAGGRHRGVGGQPPGWRPTS